MELRHNKRKEMKKTGEKKIVLHFAFMSKLENNLSVTLMFRSFANRQHKYPTKDLSLLTNKLYRECICVEIRRVTC